MTKQPMRSAPDGYLTEAETAYRLGLTAFGLRGWRRRGYGPSFKKLGRMVIYAEADIASFLTDLPRSVREG